MWISPGGGIGRRNRLKIYRWQHHESSILSLGTRNIALFRYLTSKHFYAILVFRVANGSDGPKLATQGDGHANPTERRRERPHSTPRIQYEGHRRSQQSGSLRS